MQAAYETFGCNDGNVFFMGIDKGNSNQSVIAFDSIYGIHYPSVSGNEGGGNPIHWDYNIQATPSIVVIMPDKSIAVKQIYPPSTSNVVDSVSMAGGMQQACLTGIRQPTSQTLLTVGPNPAYDELYVVVELQKPETISLELINLSGEVVRKKAQKEYSSGKHMLQWDVGDLNSGIYFVRSNSNQQVFETKKVIIRQ